MKNLKLAALFLAMGAIGFTSCSTESFDEAVDDQALEELSNEEQISGIEYEGEVGPYTEESSVGTFQKGGEAEKIALIGETISQGNRYYGPKDKDYIQSRRQYNYLQYTYKIYNKFWLRKGCKVTFKFTDGTLKSIDRYGMKVTPYNNNTKNFVLFSVPRKKVKVFRLVCNSGLAKQRL